jgi:hypothetical protein
MTFTPEQLAEQALSNILGGEIHRFYAVRFVDAIRQAVGSYSASTARALSFSKE